MFNELVSVFSISWVTLYVLRKLSRHIGLVDKPNERKHHEGAIPLVGGLSIGITLIIFIFAQRDLSMTGYVFCGSICTLLIIGALDDKYDISFKIRLLVQAGLSFAMIKFAGLDLHYLGNIFGLGKLNLDWMSYVITVFAVIGAINAFNMVDGIDGLLGGLALTSFASLGGALYLSGNIQLSYFCLILSISLLPYILFNLGVFGRTRKVFMGDAGSMVIGFTVIWLILTATQTNDKFIRPVTVLWFIAIPLVDMASIMLRRIKRGVSPFRPDREHLHHIFLRIGYTPRQTLAFICSFAILCAVFGMAGEVMMIPESVMFAIFLLFFVAYNQALTNVWVITKYFRKLKDKKKLEKTSSVTSNS